MKDNWKEISLVDLALFRRGSFPQPYGLDKWYDDNNGMPFIQVYDVDDNMKLKRVTKRKISKLAAQMSVFIPKGSLILTIQGSIGRVAITDYDAYMDRTLLVFQKFYEEVDLSFIMYIIRELFNKAKENANGSTIKTITKEELSDYTINLPPLPQQQKIAKILSTCDEVIEQTQTAIAKYQAIKQGLMHDLFELQTDKYWNFYELGDIANIIDPHPSHRAPSEDDRGIPFVGIGDIDESGNLIKNARKVSEKIFDEHYLRYKLSNKSIGFGRVATIGKIIRFKNYDFKFTVSPTMAIINPTKIESDYLSFALDSNYMKTQIAKLLTGSTRSSLGIELLRKLKVKIPIDKDEKLKISNTLNSIVQKIDTEKQALAKYQQLKEGLMQDLLTGKVEVTV